MERFSSFAQSHYPRKYDKFGPPGRQFGADRKFGSVARKFEPLSVARKFEPARLSDQPAQPNEHCFISSSKLVLAELVLPELADQKADANAPRQTGGVLERCASTGPRMEWRQFEAEKKFSSNRRFGAEQKRGSRADGEHQKRAPGSVIGSSRVMLASLVETVSAPEIATCDAGGEPTDSNHQRALVSEESCCRPDAGDHAPAAVAAEHRAHEDELDILAHMAGADAVSSTLNHDAAGTGAIKRTQSAEWVHRGMRLVRSMPDLTEMFGARRQEHSPRQQYVRYAEINYMYNVMSLLSSVMGLFSFYEMFGASGNEHFPGQLYVRYADNIGSLLFLY